MMINNLEFIIITLSSLISCALVIFFAKRLNIGLDLPSNSPQKFHSSATPRLGGIAIYTGLIVAAVLQNNATLMAMLLSVIPAFLGGIGEDITGRFKPLSRLLLTFVSAGIAYYYFDFVLVRVGIYFFDDWIAQWFVFSIAFTMFAVGGVSHSLNIIDGYNGLMSGFAILASLALMMIALQYQDKEIINLCFVLILSISGFYCWNFPSGKIFMGDGGAYLIGFFLAEIAVLFVSIYDSISPWSLFLIMAYPIVETLFSMYRKKVIRKMSPGQPDGVHLHMLVYKRLVLHYARTHNKTKKWSHAMTTLLLYSFASLPMITAQFTYQSTALTLLGLVLFTVLYLSVYFKLVSFHN